VEDVALDLLLITLAFLRLLTTRDRGDLFTKVLATRPCLDGACTVIATDMADCIQNHFFSLVNILDFRLN